MVKRRILWFALTGFTSGIWLGSIADLGWSLVGLALILVLALALAGKWLIGLESKTAFFLSLFFLALTLGAARVNYSLDNGQVIGNWQPLIGERTTFTGVVIAEPEERETYTKLIVKEEKTEIKFLLRAPIYPEVGYGDLVQVVGVLERPENFANESGLEFDYVSYLAKDGIYLTVENPTVESLGENHGSVIKKTLLAIKARFLASLNRTLPEPSASLAAGLILGAKRGLGQELNEHFRRAGLSHIVVLSGFNLAVVASFLLIFFSFLPPPANWLLAGGGIIFFTIMSGGEAAAVRAALMALVALLARSTGRLYDATSALFLAGAAMIIWNPLLLAFDIGFQLSFLATLGLIFISPVLASLLSRLPKKFGFAELVYSSLAAQLAVAPWIAYRLGQISLVSLPANLLVLPLVPLAMLTAFLSGLTGLISSFLAIIPAAATEFLLTTIVSVASYFSAWSWASITVRLPLAVCLLVYLLLIIGIFSLSRRISSSA